jgi:hypothetical protein
VARDWLLVSRPDYGQNGPHQLRRTAILQNPHGRRCSDILYVQEWLLRAGVDEGALRQRRAFIERSAPAATLVVELFEPEPRRTMDLGNHYAGDSASSEPSPGLIRRQPLCLRYFWPFVGANGANAAVGAGYQARAVRFRRG